MPISEMTEAALIDYATASVEDTAMSARNMMFNPANWEFAAQLIEMGEVDLAEVVEIAADCPVFWSFYMNGGAAA